MSKWWKDPRLDDEGTYDYLVEELPQDNSVWSWYPSKCDDCGKERRLNRTDSHYFYCWDGWDSMEYTTCWKCHLKSVIRSIMSKIKRYIRKCKFFNIRARLEFRKFCYKNNISRSDRKKIWETYYDFWTDNVNIKILKGDEKK